MCTLKSTICDKYKEICKIEICHDYLTVGSSILMQEQFNKETAAQYDEMTKWRRM
jgi:hypothetical protein